MIEKPLAKMTDWTRWLVGAPPKNTVHSLSAGEPPLPGLDRHHRPLPPRWLEKCQRKFRGLRVRTNKWIRNGMPIIPSFKMNSRSPSFVLLVMSLVVLGMILPEILGLTTGSLYSAYSAPQL